MKTNIDALRPLRGRAFAILLAGSAIGGIGLPSAALAQEAQPAVSAGSESGDIIVTATRRAEMLQDVPVQITAFSGDRLEQKGIRGEQDLQASVPSLVVGPNGQASRDAPSFTLRGMGATFQASPGVAVYLAEVPLPSPLVLSQQGGPGNFIDIENLQVLAGPQGTLFGRNTTGGAVLIVPRKPQNELGGYWQLRVGNYRNIEAEGAINVPVVEDKLLVRATVAHRTRDGFTEDVVWNKDRDNINWSMGRLSIIARPTESLENYLLVYGSVSSNNGAGLIHRAFNVAGMSALGLCSDAPGTPYASSCNVYRAASAQADALGIRKTAMSNDVGQRTETWGAINTTSFDFSDNVTVRNIFSYQAFKGWFSYDGDATVLQQHDVVPTRLPGLGQAVLPGTNTPIYYANAGASPELPRDDFRTITEELQLQGNAVDNHLQYTVGGFYFDQKPIGAQGGDAIVYCPAAFTGFCPAGPSLSGVRQTSYALYAHGSFDFGALSPALDSLRLTAGYRHTWDRIKGFSTRFNPSATKPDTAVCSSDGTEVPLASAYTDCEFSSNLRTNAGTWVVGLDYRASSDIMFFGKISRGYKSGGFNPFAVFENTRTFLPEYVTAYEAGLKSNYRLGDVSTRFNLTLFNMDYTDIQRATGDYNSSTNAAGAKTVNADARIRGIEIDASIRPIPEIEIGGNFSYTDAKYTEYSFQVNGFFPQQSCNGPVMPGQIANMKCLPFQYVSPYIWSAFVALDLPLPGEFATLSAMANYSHSSSQFTDATQLESVQPGSRLEPFGLLNVSMDLKNIGGSGLTVGAFATNLTNKTYRTSNTDVYQTGSLLYWSTLYGEPRMFGLRLRYDFNPK